MEFHCQVDWIQFPNDFYSAIFEQDRLGAKKVACRHARYSKVAVSIEIERHKLAGIKGLTVEQLVLFRLQTFDKSILFTIVQKLFLLFLENQEVLPKATPSEKHQFMSETKKKVQVSSCCDTQAKKEALLYLNASGRCRVR